MPTIMVTGNPLICYCGKATKVYDSLFRRNFCSDECSNALMLFLGGCDKSVEIMKEVKAGDFKIRGSVVTLDGTGFSDTLIKHTFKKAASIDKIDAQVVQQQAEDKDRKELRKLGLDEKTIEAMLLAKAGGVK